jgi:hypothetical protein
MASHQAIVAKITEVIEIPGADRVQISVVLGEHCVTSKEWCVGDAGVLFPVDLQLSEEFCHQNNLNRDKSKNKDQEKAGFFDANRRVRAQPFLKVKSTGLFMPMSSLEGFCTQEDVQKLTVGTQFDSLNGKKICQKYISEKTRNAIGNNGTKAKKKTLVPDFKEHIDTENFKYSINKIKKGDVIYFHSKRHGTSLRSARTKVYKDKSDVVSKLKQTINKITKRDLFEIEQEWNWEYVTGSRRVILDAEKVGDGWHGNNSYRFEVTDVLKPYLEDSYCAYGEIVGFVNGSPIMGKHNVKDLKDKRYIEKYGDTITYKYKCKEHQYKFHIYRITYMDVNGNTRDMSQKELEKFCKDRDIPCTLEVHPPIVYDGDEEKLRTLVESLTERPEVLTEDFEDSSMISEGIILRIENGNTTPLFLKSKSYPFLCMESIIEAVDPEDAS